MEENIADTLMTLSGVLHWLGRYREAKALVYFSRMCRATGLDSLYQVEEHVLALEMAAKVERSDTDNAPAAKALLRVAKAAKELLDYRGPGHGDWALRNKLGNALAAYRHVHLKGDDI